MEFIHSVNILRRQMPVPFFLLLVFIPAVTLALLLLASRVMEGSTGDTFNIQAVSFFNIYTAGIFGFYGLINLSFWCKHHYRRLEFPGMAKRWERVPDIACAILIATVIFL